MRDKKVSTAINKMAIPAIVGLIMMGIYNIVDTMFVAWLGTAETGATQVVLPISLLITSLGLALGIGSGAYISRLLGMNKRETADTVGSTIFFTALICGIIFTIVSITFLDSLLSFFGASGAVLSHSRSYGFYILLGSMFQVGMMTMNNMLRSEGSARLSMIGQSAGALINIILDPLFIFVFDMGIAGAAIATTISKVIAFFILLSPYLRHQTVVRISLAKFRPSKSIYRETAVVGIPTFLRQILISLSVGFLNQRAMIIGGETLLAAVGLVWKVSLFLFLIILGLGQGVQPVIGYNMGAGRKDRVLGSIRYALIISISIAMIFSICLVLFGKQILGIFRPEPSVLDFGIIGLRFNAIALLLMAISNTITVFYQALGRAKESLLLSISRQGLFLIPAILILPSFFGTMGTLGAQLAADVLTLLLALVLFIPYIRGDKLDGNIREYITKHGSIN